MGWLTLALWLGSVFVVSQYLPVVQPWFPPGLSKAAVVFIGTAVLSSPTIYLLGKLLNRHKQARTIMRWGKPREVLWGTHTFQMLPMEFYGFIIPLMTALGWLMVHFVA